ncbi:MAG: methylthioribulose 1-phosphate dehydratase [Pseudohongiella sp.]|nr:methylthioribulose 1-phosphate dehydratase [Pseudohongiella sp.]
MNDAQTIDPTHSDLRPQGFEQAAAGLIRAGQRLWSQGYCPATSSNFSQRLNGHCCAITVSGRDKGNLQPGDIMLVDMDGRSLDGNTPSAETLLHTQLYLRDANIGAVLHTHSVKAALVSMNGDGPVVLEGLELLKALNGVKTHNSRIEIPVFDNTQDIAALARQVDGWMSASVGNSGTVHAYLIRGHGLYSWGRDLGETLRHIEALEYLLDYYWHQMLLRKE